MQKAQRSRSPPVKSLGKVAVMKFLNVFSCVLFKLIILCGSILLLLRIFGISADVILSGSMEPALRTGESHLQIPGSLFQWRAISLPTV